MRRKKTFSLLLALLMMASLLLGCAENVQMEEHDIPLDNLPDGQAVEEVAEGTRSADESASAVNIEAKPVEEAAPTEEPSSAAEAISAPAEEPAEVVVLETTEEPQRETAQPQSKDPAEETEAPVEEPAPAAEEPAPAAEEPAPAAEETEAPVEETEAPAEEPAPAAEETTPTEAPKADAEEDPDDEESPANEIQPTDTAAPVEDEDDEEEQAPATETTEPTETTAEPVEEAEEETDEETAAIGLETPAAIDLAPAETTEPEVTAPPEVTEETEPSPTPSLEDPSQDKDNYEKGVWLHVINGGFKDTDAGSVWVNFQDNTRKLPTQDKLPEATRTGGVFEGWYTTSGKEYLQKSEEGNYSYWHSEKPSGQKIVPGETEVPKGIQVLYAYFTDKEEKADNERRVEYYLDYNGINGMWGHCLTSIRSYEEKTGGHTLTLEELLIRYLNWDGESINPQSMQDLSNYWYDKTFNGYKFLGWSSDPKSMICDVEAGYVVKDGESIYAVWQKDGESSDTFDRYNANKGPVQSMHLEGLTGNHTTGSMTWTAHAKKGDSVSVSLVTTPAGATFEQLIWTVTSGGKTQTITYNSDGGTFETEGGQGLSNLDVSVSDCGLTVTYTDDGQQTRKEGEAAPAVTVLINVTAVNNKNALEAAKKRGIDVPETVQNSGLPVTAIFNHSWTKTGTAKTYDKEGKEISASEASCGSYTTTEYICSGCGAKKTESSAPVEHVYEKNVIKDRCSKTTKEPTCTEAGVRHLLCLRCGEERTDLDIAIPALGHDIKKTTIPADCIHNEIIEECQREGCDYRVTSLVRGSNPDLHKYKEVRQEKVSCVKNQLIEDCMVCGITHLSLVDADNRTEDNLHHFKVVNWVPYNCQYSTYTLKCSDCGFTKAELRKMVNSKLHKWKEEGKTPADCNHVSVSFKCSVCSAKKTELQKEKTSLPHKWGEWKETKAPTVSSSGEQARTCLVCGTKQTKVVARLTKPSAATAKPVPEATEKPATFSAKQTQTVSAVASAAAAKKLATPSGIKAAASGTNVKISWSKVSGAAKYRVFYKTGSGSWKKLADTTSTSYTWKSAKAGTKYSFTVRCLSADGKTYTSDYNTKGVSFTTAAAKKLATPSGIKAAASGSNVKISWGKVSSAAKYRVFYKTGNGSWKKLADTTSTSYTWKSAKAGTKYSFTVRCLSADGKTYTSDYNTKGVSFTTAAAKKLATPSGIKAAASGTNVKISWSKVSGAAKYRVFYKTGSGSWKKLADTTSTSYTWKSAKAGTKYSFTVRCLSADGKTYTSDYNTKGVSCTAKK